MSHRISATDGKNIWLLPASVPELTGLRGVAVILVTLYHGGFPPVVGGSLGVDIFFILSGFLITSLLIREKSVSGKVNLRNFYLRRLLRLGPALILMLIGVTVFAYSFIRQTFEHTAVDAFIALIYATNWSRALVFHEPIFFGHVWSLSVEEQFYILWPVIFIMLLRCSIRGRLVAMIILAAAPMIVRVMMQHAGVSIFRIYNGTDARADDLMIGCILAILISRYGNFLASLAVFRSTVRYGSIGAFLVLLLLSVTLNELSAFGNYFGYPLIQISACIIIVDVVLSGDGLVKRLLSSRALLWFGRISYSLYLWHWPSVVVFAYYGFSKKQTSGMALASALLTGALSYYLVETRFLRMKLRFESDRAKESGEADLKVASPI